MIIPELRDLTSPDLPDLDSATFAEGSSFRIGLAAEIGPVGQRGADLFYFVALSPAATATLLEDGPCFCTTTYSWHRSTPPA